MATVLTALKIPAGTWTADPVHSNAAGELEMAGVAQRIEARPHARPRDEHDGPHDARIRRRHVGRSDGFRELADGICPKAAEPYSPTRSS